MKLFTGVVTAMALACPALAQDAGTDASTMTCAEFVALDSASRTSAMASIQAAAAAAAAAIREGTGVDTPADDPTVDGAASAGTGTAGPDGDTAAAADAGATNAGAPAETGTTGGDNGDMTVALLDACSSVPDMRVTDAMMQAQAGGGSEGDAGATGSDAGGG